MRRIAASSQQYGPTLLIVAALASPAMQPDVCSQQRNGDVIDVRASYFDILRTAARYAAEPAVRNDWLLRSDSLFAILWKSDCVEARTGNVLRLRFPDDDPFNGVMSLRSTLGLTQLHRLLRHLYERLPHSIPRYNARSIITPLSVSTTSIYLHSDEAKRARQIAEAFGKRG
ncbi:hypothetical protein AAGS40_30600 (plasmid) [Paraburkholderia sp. PREW-6R]|uniref:hypothetical protein n=1 Tax=Paraburkholderia sp. PREW-6R TaxID=3141544 RepID=UPI0031F49B44